jgi:hypothetical protein
VNVKIIEFFIAQKLVSFSKKSYKKVILQKSLKKNIYLVRFALELIEILYIQKIKKNAK